jgi:hypothetical protein
MLVVSGTLVPLSDTNVNAEHGEQVGRKIRRLATTISPPRRLCAGVKHLTLAPVGGKENVITATRDQEADAEDKLLTNDSKVARPTRSVSSAFTFVLVRGRKQPHERRFVMFGKMFNRLVVGMLTLGLVLSFVAVTEASQGGEAKFETLAKGSRGGPRQAEQRVITTDKDLEALWKEYRPGRRPSLQKVDFDKQIVIAVALGSGGVGRSIAITRIEQTQDGVRVYYKEESRWRRGQYRPHIAYQTGPYQIVKLDKPTGEVRFIKEEAKEAAK